MTTSKDPWPTEIRVNPARDALCIAFDDGQNFTLSAEFLRVHSPSAEVKGHGEGERKIIGGKRTVMISSVEPTGNYAVRLIFSDGHNTGLYSWAYLHEIGSDQSALWAQYLADLDMKGLNRG